MRWPPTGCASRGRRTTRSRTSAGRTPTDALDQLAALLPDELLNTEPSRYPDFAIIWIFCPALPEEDDTFLWIRLAERSDETFVVSFQPALRDPWR